MDRLDGQQTMKILQVLSAYPPMVGGVENSVYTLVSNLRRAGNEVSVITSGMYSHGLQDGVWRLRILIRLERDWGDLLFCPTIFNVLRKVDFEIVHAHTPRKLFAEVIPFYKLLSTKKFPYIVSVRLLNESLHGLPMGITKVYQETAEKYMLKNAEYVVVQSAKNREIISEKFNVSPDRIFIIPNAVDTGFYDPQIYRRDEDQERDVNERIVLALGRLTAQKGFEYLIRAIPIVEASFPEARFWIVGDGPLKSYLQDLSLKLGVAKKVSFLGEVSHDETVELYSKAEVFVMPSLSESFPNVMLEAMAMENATVATKVGVVPELATDRENSMLVNPRSVNQLADSIIVLLSDDSLRRRIGVNARKLVKEKYSWDFVTRKTLQLYQKALA